MARTVERTWTRTPISMASFFMESAYLQKILMRVETSTGSRLQFSVEKAYTVNCWWWWVQGGVRVNTLGLELGTRGQRPSWGYHWG